MRNLSKTEKFGRLLEEHYVRYENKARHSGRRVRLTYMIVDAEESEVIN